MLRWTVKWKMTLPLDKLPAYLRLNEYPYLIQYLLLAIRLNVTLYIGRGDWCGNQEVANASAIGLVHRKHPSSAGGPHEGSDRWARLLLIYCASGDTSSQVRLWSWPILMLCRWHLCQYHTKNTHYTFERVSNHRGHSKSDWNLV